MQSRVFDPARDFLILTELFGNGRSSSPSNTPESFHGPRFPVMTIRDNVDAVYRLVTTELRVKHLITDARYEQALIPRVTFSPIPSLWGHTAGAASNPADLRFLNDRIAAFLEQSRP